MSSGLEPVRTALNQPYWEGTAAGELRVRLCHACGARFRFVREVCPVCWSDDLGWVASDGRGTVIARAIVTTAPYAAMAARTPYVLALIKLDDGPTMMANILECDPSTVEIGLPVEVFFEQRGEFALPQFRPSSPVRD